MNNQVIQTVSPTGGIIIKSPEWTPEQLAAQAAQKMANRLAMAERKRVQLGDIPPLVLSQERLMELLAFKSDLKVFIPQLIALREKWDKLAVLGQFPCEGDKLVKAFQSAIQRALIQW